MVRSRKFDEIVATLRRQLPARSFLDAGCGDGRYLSALAGLPDAPARIAGSDISARILQTAQLACPNAELVRANLELLPFADGAFDLVLCTQVIEHLLDPAAGARELARVLAPGGTLVFSTDNRRNTVTRALNAPRYGMVAALHMRGRRKNVDFPHRDFTDSEVRALLEDAGLRVDELRTFRFTLIGGGRFTRTAIDAIERRLRDRGVGDILLAVARKP